MRTLCSKQNGDRLGVFDYDWGVRALRELRLLNYILRKDMEDGAHKEIQGGYTNIPIG